MAARQEQRQVYTDKVIAALHSRMQSTGPASTNRRLVEGFQTMNDEPDRESSSARNLIQPDLFERDVFVFSPDGELFALPKGATMLDFAYRIHSKLGDHCVGAMVDGRMVPLRYKVKNGETVEILQSSTQRPHQEWLKLVRTSKAKQRIKSWLRKQSLGHEGVAVGRDLLEKGLRRSTAAFNWTRMDKMYRFKSTLAKEHLHLNLFRWGLFNL